MLNLQQQKWDPQLSLSSWGCPLLILGSGGGSGLGGRAHVPAWLITKELHSLRRVSLPGCLPSLGNTGVWHRPVPLAWGGALAGALKPSSGYSGWPPGPVTFLPAGSFPFPSSTRPLTVATWHILRYTYFLALSFNHLSGLF